MANASVHPLAHLKSSNQIWRLLQQNKDALLPIIIVGILLIMIVPVAPWMMDLLLILSISSAILILLIAIYTATPLDFSVFPSLLLIITLFRLALNIATVRLILLHGNEGTNAAGRLIEAFGGFVIGGNYVVGLIIFSILIVINFVVITKGAGRVAEVSARFTLDAMPGKQMSIDSELNAGLIDQNEARERRKIIGLEADFYGSMDGASKFVRGDAIAGIVILVISIAGGFIIGVLQHGMAISSAAKTYALLTVGDGLVSQIPSLVVSTAAGLIATRAANDSNLSSTVGAQLFAQSKPVYTLAGILLLCGLIPGMPFIPFFILAVIIGFIAGTVGRSAKFPKLLEPKNIDSANQFETCPNLEFSNQPEILAPLEMLSIEVGYGLIGLINEQGDLPKRIKLVRRQFALESGFVIPPIHFRDNLELGPFVYKILLKGCPIAEFELLKGHLLAMGEAEDQGRLLNGIPLIEPAFGLSALWVADSKRDEASALGYTVVDSPAVIATHVAEVLKSHAHELLTRQETQGLIDMLAKKFPKLVEDVVPDILPLGLIQKVLQNLLRERVPIRDMLTILETLAEQAVSIKDPILLTEYVRQALARHITQPLLAEDGTLRVMMLDRDIEETILRATKVTDQGMSLIMEPEAAQCILNVLEQGIEQWSDTLGMPIVTCLPAVRASLRRLAENFFPELIILSHNEIPAHIHVQTLNILSHPNLIQA